jgi:NAD(P)-dependent dehydrogenase (short-subunit alcohol dehydrogenase family)
VTDNDRGTLLITGANRGIGLEMTRQYAAEGWRVLATCRRPESAVNLCQLASEYPRHVFVHTLDVCDDLQIASLGEALQQEALDLLINNAGWGDGLPGLRDVTYKAWEQCMRVNAFATLRMTQVFADHVARSRRKFVLAIGSRMGSIAENTSGDATPIAPPRRL